MKKTLSPSPNKKELLAGLIYLGLQWLLIPVAFVAVNSFLGEPLTNLELNCSLFILNFIATGIIFHRFLRFSLKTFFSRFRESLGTALVGLGLYFAGNLVASLIILAVDPDFANVNDANVAGMVSENFALMAVCTMFLVPVAEELLYRGILFGGLYNKNAFIAYSVSTLVFCAIHVAPYIGIYPAQTLLLCLLQYITPSIVLAWSWQKSGSIVTPMLIHITINSFGILAMR